MVSKSNNFLVSVGRISVWWSLEQTLSTAEASRERGHSTNERSHWIKDNTSNPNLNNNILLKNANLNGRSERENRALSSPVLQYFHCSSLLFILENPKEPLLQSRLQLICHTLQMASPRSVNLFLQLVSIFLYFAADRGGALHVQFILQLASQRRCIASYRRNTIVLVCACASHL